MADFHFRTAMSAIVLAASLIPVVVSAPQGQTVAVPGLSESVEIVKDRWGISHIYARNEKDLFFAQGYNAARDRLFQLEMWRRQATGTSAQILGRRGARRDIAARLFQFRGDLKQEFNHYHPRGEQIVEAFVDGINAYIGEAARDPERLPLEFRLLGIRPEPWQPKDVISRHQGLFGNVSGEIDMALAVKALGVEKVRDLSWFRPGEPELALDPTIDGAPWSEEILALYQAFRGPLRFAREDLAANYRAGMDAEMARASLSPSEYDLLREGEAIGSNNWVVGGDLTLSGHPIMANDPHRAQQVPSLRYWVHLVAPGWNVIGGGEPVLPGVSIGHNEYGAWGLTVFGQDSEDLYVYRTDPENSNRYRYRDSWEEMKVLRDTIEIKGERPLEVELKYTRHGPVVYEDRAGHWAFAVRAAWMDIGSAPYLASLRMNQASTWEEFRDACDYSRIPAENMVWADVHNNIGYQAVGVSPIRRNWSGLVPVPGDGRYEWDGYLPIKALPHRFNPAKGYLATANNYQVPDGYPYKEALHYSWGDEMRAARIEEVLGSGRKHTLVDMMRLQHDELSIPARSLVPFLRDLRSRDSEVEKARNHLLSWDYVLDKDSTAASLYVTWEGRLRDGVTEVLVPREAREAFGRINLKRMIDFLAAPDGRFGKDPVAARDALMLRALEEAVSELHAKLGVDIKLWKYGQEKFKHALIRHPLAEIVPENLRGRLNVGPLPRGGYGSTVNNTGNGLNQTSGASFRIIADTGNWDNSVGSNAPGQSGNPDDPHYKDLFELWANGKYFPVFFSRNKVDSVAESRIFLEPLTTGRR